MRISKLEPKGAGPCAKQVVTATLIAKNGARYVGTNHCMTPQQECPREKAGMLSGQGYYLCKSVCDQRGHAEENALHIAGVDTIDSTLYVEGHTYACSTCKDAAGSAGVAKIVIGSPPP